MCMKLFGTTVFSLRLPSAIAGLVIVMYSFFFSKKILNDWRPGFFAGLIVVTSLGFIDYHVARNGDFDAMLAMWIFLYSAQFFVYLQTKERKYLIFASLFLAFAILTKGIAGSLFVPGLLLIVLINKEYRTILKKKEFYVFVVSGLLLGVSYYFIRELNNPGYIDAVIKNELLGRYMEVKEDHRESAWFYLQLLNDSHFSTWLYWLPVAIFIVVVTKDEWVKKIGIFVVVQIVCYVLIISFSETKLKWYDAPLYPFMAILIGLAIFQLYVGIKERLDIKKQFQKGLLFLLLCVSTFSVPVQTLSKSSLFIEKETSYTGLFYGDFMKNYFDFFPQQKSLRVIYYGYNPHLVFYSTIYQHQGLAVEPIMQNAEIHIHDTIMICDKTMWPNFNPNYKFDTLYQEGEHKFILTLVDSTVGSDRVKKLENKFFIQLGAMQNNLEWLDTLKEKAESKRIDLKKQMMYDAFWMLSQGVVLTPEEESYLKNKYQL